MSIKNRLLVLFTLTVVTSATCNGSSSSSAGLIFGNNAAQNTANFEAMRDEYNGSVLHKLFEADMQDCLQTQSSQLLQAVIMQTAVEQTPLNQAALCSINLATIRTIIGASSIVYHAYKAFLFLSDLVKVSILHSFLDAAMHFEGMIKQVVNQTKKVVVKKECLDETYNSIFLAMAGMHSFSQQNQNQEQTFNSPTIEAKWNGAKEIMKFPIASELAKKHNNLRLAEESTDKEKLISVKQTEMNAFILSNRLDLSLVKTYQNDWNFAYNSLKNQAERTTGDKLETKERGAFDGYMYNSCALLSATSQCDPDGNAALFQRLASTLLIMKQSGTRSDAPEIGGELNSVNQLQEDSKALLYATYNYVSNPIALYPALKPNDGVILHGFGSGNYLKDYLTANYTLWALMGEGAGIRASNPYAPFVLYAREGGSGADLNQNRTSSSSSSSSSSEIPHQDTNTPGHFVQLRPIAETDEIRKQRYNPDWMHLETIPLIWPYLTQQINDTHNLDAVNALLGPVFIRYVDKNLQLQLQQNLATKELLSEAEQLQIALAMSKSEQHLNLQNGLSLNSSSSFSSSSSASYTDATPSGPLKFFPGLTLKQIDDVVSQNEDEETISVLLMSLAENQTDNKQSGSSSSFSSLSTGGQNSKANKLEIDLSRIDFNAIIGLAAEYSPNSRPRRKTIGAEQISHVINMMGEDSAQDLNDVTERSDSRGSQIGEEEQMQIAMAISNVEQ
jgi:hypothetical protein